jgi:membrane protease YdiL (CAAX protease family)
MGDHREGIMNRAIVAFIAIAYGLSATLSGVIWATGGHDSGLVGVGFISMLFPALAALIVKLSMGEGFAAIDWGRFPVRYLPAALLLMPVVLHATMLPTTYALESRLPWQEWLSPQPDGLRHAPAELGWGVLSEGDLITRIALNAGIGLVVVSVLAFFEEVGWRAWLLPRLTKRLGVAQAILATSVVWALWHVPFTLSGIQYIEGMSPGLTALVMPIGQLGAGMILGCLWLRTESVALVALSHGALNNWGQFAFKFMTTSGPDDWLILLVGNLALLLVGGLLIGSLPSSLRHEDEIAVTANA